MPLLGRAHGVDLLRQAGMQALQGKPSAAEQQRQKLKRPSVLCLLVITVIEVNSGNPYNKPVVTASKGDHEFVP
ncbi:hypothetical protein AOLI_G00250180 [Acnodon oligacanthus]